MAQEVIGGTMDLYDEKHRIIAPIYEDLQQNIRVIDDLFRPSGDIVKKQFTLTRKDEKLDIFIAYVDGVTDSEVIERTVLRPLLYEWRREGESRPFHAFLYEEIERVDLAEKTNMEDAITAMLRGDTLILVDGYAKALLLATRKPPVRGIDQAPSEQGTRGPRDGFIESLRICTGLLRRRIKDPKLKVEQMRIGQRTKSDYAICYMEDIAHPELVEELKSRMEEYEVDGILDTGMLEHLIEKKWYSPFPTCQVTERPDKVASALLEGRVAVMLDNSPQVLIMPATFGMFFQASDDYYNRWWVASFARVLRFFAAWLTIALPGLYVAITSFHTEVLPTDLLLAISAARTAVTFPVLLEVLLMELLFELLREAGIRLPGQMGNTIGVVGGLIVGQSAVDANLVSTIVVIVVALSAISAFCIPNEAFTSAFRLTKFLIIILAGIWGFYGFLFGMLILAIHFAGLTSYGVPYMYPTVGGEEGSIQHLKDFVLRAPFKMLYDRPPFANDGEKVRIKRKDQL